LDIALSHPEPSFSHCIPYSPLSIANSTRPRTTPPRISYVDQSPISSLLPIATSYFITALLWRRVQSATLFLVYPFIKSAKLRLWTLQDCFCITMGYAFSSRNLSVHLIHSNLTSFVNINIFPIHFHPVHKRWLEIRTRQT